MVQLVQSAAATAQTRPIQRLTRGQLMAAIIELAGLQGAWVFAVQKGCNGDLSLQLQRADPDRDNTLVIFSDAKGLVLGALDGDEWQTLGVYTGLPEALAEARKAASNGPWRLPGKPAEV